MGARLMFVICCFLAVLVAACDDQAPGPYLKFAGGGFMFNYRYSRMTYGFVARQLKPLPEGSVLEATFDLPQTEAVIQTKSPSTW